MKHVTSVLSTLLLAATAAACATQTDEASTATRPTTTETTEKLDLALVGSFTGSTDSAVANDVQRGVLVAVNQLNALGGIRGRQIVLHVVDDEGKAENTAARIQELADKSGVVLGIGPSTSKAATAMLPLVKAGKVLYISPSATSMDLDCTESAATAEERAKLCEAAKASFDPNGPVAPVLFRTATSDAFLATALAQAASETVGGARRCRSIAIVRQDDAYGQPLAARVDQRFRQLSLEVRRTVDLDPAATDEFLRYDVEAVAGTPPPDCQVVIASTTVASSYMKAFGAWRDAHPGVFPANFQTIGGDGFRDDAFTTAATAAPGAEGVPAIEGSLAVAADTAPTTPEYSTFKALHEAQFPDVKPGRFAAPAYDAMVLLAGAVARAGSTTAVPAIREALVELTSGRRYTSAAKVDEFMASAASGEDIDYQGASGPIDFDARTGGVRNDFGLWRIKQAAFVREATFDASVVSGD